RAARRDERAGHAGRRERRLRDRRRGERQQSPAVGEQDRVADVRREPDGRGDDAEHEEDRGGLCHLCVPTLGPCGRFRTGWWISRSGGGGATGRRPGAADGTGDGGQREREAAVAADVLGRLADEAALGARDEEVVAGLRARGARLVDRELAEAVRL